MLEKWQYKDLDECLAALGPDRAFPENDGKMNKYLTFCEYILFFL